MKKKFISFLTYNYFAQQFLYYTFFFSLREYLIKFYNYLFKNLDVNQYFINELKTKKKSKDGWSIIFLTYDIKKNLTKKYQNTKRFLKKRIMKLLLLQTLINQKLH